MLRAEPITDRLWRLRRGLIVNAYVVREDDGSLTLVDTLFRGSAGPILDACAALGPITRIVLTHAHWDHVGSVDELARRLEGVEVIAGAREARILGGDRTLLPGEPAGPTRTLTSVQVPVTRAVAAGERVGSLEVHDAPGHTPGQIALLDVRDQTLFAADAFTTLGGVRSVGRVQLPFPLPALVSWDRPTAARTAAALTALEPARLACGHGPVVEDPVRAMQAVTSETP